MKSKAYAAKSVNEVAVKNLVKGRDGQPVVVGVDVGKFELRVVARWGDQQFERPWRVANPSQVPILVRLLQGLASGRSLRVALEPSGTYGDALRQALHDAGLETWRINPKLSKDYAEIFDGVPSQHDGKDAAIIAELTALGKASLWSSEPAPAWEQELSYWVDGLEAQRRILMLWQGRLEALLARHWPEATRVLRGSSATLLRVLAKYGGPAGLAADPQAEARLQDWGGRFLGVAKARALLASARTTVGVRPQEWQQRQIREEARHALEARRQFRHRQAQLRRLAKDHEVLSMMGQAVGVPTACVLWASVGDPRAYASGPAYRKAMGLNLVERSSGTHQGELHLSKRGHPRSRQWLYFAALRLVQRGRVRRWYEAKKARDGQEAKRAVVAVMRKLALAVYRVAQGRPFDPERLFCRVTRRLAGTAGSRR
jgi:transposase